jgi:hypothetical protein
VTDCYVVCGSRDWPKDKLWFVTQKMIELIPHGELIVTGGAAGVDDWADLEASRLNYQTKVIPADWKTHGRRAGFIRNVIMLEEDPVAVLAFQWANSRGTAHTIREAYKRGIPTHHFTEESLRPDIAALDSDDEPIAIPHRQHRGEL